jgi:hypothetical protein
LQLNTITNTFAEAKLDKLYVLLSTPVSLKSGATAPISSVLGSGWISWAIAIFSFRQNMQTMKQRRIFFMMI